MIHNKTNSYSITDKPFCSNI